MAEVAPPLLETSPGSEFTVSATTRSIKPNQSPTLCSAKCEQLREQRVCVNKLQVLRNKPRRNQITWVGLTPRRPQHGKTIKIESPAGGNQYANPNRF